MVRKRLAGLAFVFAGVLASLLACSPSEHGAAPFGVIDGDTSCPDCEIGFRLVATLGGEDDPGSVWDRAAGDGCMVARSSTGEFLLGGVAGGGNIFVYDADGTFNRSFSQEGQGPGEIRGMVRIWVGPGDTLFVADDGNNRMQVLTSLGDYVRSFPMPAPFRRFARLATGDFLFGRSVQQRGDDMMVLVDADGQEIEKFSPSMAAEPDLERAIASPRPGTGAEAAFWVASMWRYAVEEWSVPGASEPTPTLLRTLARDSDWFPPYPEFGPEVYESAPPPPGLHHVWEDEDGLLWMYVLLPDSNWRPGIPLDSRPAWYRDTFDHRVEVVDPSSGRLVAVGEHEDRLSPVCGSNLMYAVTETPEGDLRVHVVEPQLTRGSHSDDMGRR